MSLNSSHAHCTILLMEITVVVDLYGNSLGTRLIRKEMDAEEPGESNEQHSAEVAAGEAQVPIIAAGEQDTDQKTPCKM